MRGCVAVLLCIASVTFLAADQYVFKDDRVSVAIPDGWSVSTVTTAVRGDRTYRQPIGAALTRGSYTLYLLTHYGQASGIIGGRFGEIAEYVAPWVDRTNPSPCIDFLEKRTTRVTSKLSRVDLYFDSAGASAEALERCGRPSVRAVLWYGSYFTLACSGNTSSDCGGFFLELPLLSGKNHDAVHPSESQMAITLSFRAARPNDLPRRGDAQLNEFLARASTVVGDVTFK